MEYSLALTTGAEVHPNVKSRGVKKIISSPPPQWDIFASLHLEKYL